MRHSPFDIDPLDANPLNTESPPQACQPARMTRFAPQLQVAVDVGALRTAPAGLRFLLSKQLLPLLLTVVIGWLLWGKIAHLDIASIISTVATVRPHQWGLAGLATCGSFWAVGQYDRVLHAQLGTGVSAQSARTSGIAAIGLSQFLGFGALTGTLIRWRMLPELTLWQAARLSGAVALSFLAGWAVVAALAVLALQPDIPWMKTLATGAIVLATGMAVVSVYPPGPLVRLPWPSLSTMGTVIGLAAMDTILSGLALYAVMPAELALALSQTISAYLFSLGAGIISSTPGGIGPFEATLSSLLPTVELEPLLGAVVAFRLVYYALPATLAGLLTLRGPRRSNLSREPQLIKPTLSPLPLARNGTSSVFRTACGSQSIAHTRFFAPDLGVRPAFGTGCSDWPIAGHALRSPSRSKLSLGHTHRTRTRGTQPLPHACDLQMRCAYGRLCPQSRLESAPHRPRGLARPLRIFVGGVPIATIAPCSQQSRKIWT